MNFDVLIGKKIIKVTDEETEVKNKVELKSWFEDDKLYVGEYVKHKINQLGEPEVTLDKAFEKVAESYSMTKEEVWRRIEWFENHTEVLSQELPVIPKYVADWFEENKEHFEDRLKSAIKYREINDGPSEFDIWLDNPHNKPLQTLGNMFNGYEMEEEQKYYVLDKNGCIILRRYEDEGVSFMKISTTLTVKKFEESTPDRLDSIQLTEQEIKDYDERYIPFMVPVEESEY